MRRLVAETSEDALRITGVPNGRLCRERTALQLLAAADPASTVGALRQALSYQHADGVDPEDIWELETEMSYGVFLDYSDGDSNGNFDILLLREGVTPAEALVPQQPGQRRAPQSLR